MHGKTMKEALMEVRSFRDTSDIEEVKLGFMARNRELAKLPKPIIPQPPIMPVTKEGGPGSGPQKGGKKYSSADIKKAYGILNDPRYKQGNFSGAAKAIDKLSPGLSDHPDVKNAMKRANEALDLPATGDTTTSNASQEDLEEGSINEILPALAVGAAAAATGAAAYKAGGAIYKGVSKIKKNLSNYGKRTSNPAGESVDEAKLSTAQLDTLKQKYSGLKGSEKNGIQMDKLAKIMKRYPESMLDQLAGLDIPMVSKVAKSMTEAVVGLPFSRTLMYIIKTDRNTATRIKSFLADNGEKYPIYIDDNGSGQITLDAYEYTGGEKKAALAAAQAIAKKFNVKVNATR
jgi:hypothetical protein